MYNKISKIKYKMLRHWLSAPFILGMIIPLLIFDLCIEIYHRVTFPLYGIAIVQRRHYITLDRVKLSYLNIFDRLWCAYCQYANGLMAYSVKIAGDTEKYWCAIKNKGGQNYIPQEHQKDFLEYGDKDAYDKFIKRS